MQVQGAEMRIVLPCLPPREASPNWRGHWSKKSRAVAEFRSLARLMAKQSMNEWVAPEKAIVKYTFIVPDRARRDIDNLVAASKGALDGIVDAGAIRDDCGRKMMLDMPEIIYQKGKRETVIDVRDYSHG